MWSIYGKKTVLQKALERMRMSKWRTFSHKYDRWRKQTVCECHFTMTCSGPRSRTRTSAVYLKMWRVSKHLRQSTYEWAGGVCVSCLRALQSWLMCIESSCVMHRHTHTHTLAYKHTHRAHAKSSNAADFFPPPYCGCCHGNKLRISGFEKLYLTWSVSVSEGAVGIIRGVWTGAGVDLLFLFLLLLLLLSVFAQVRCGVLIAPKTLTPM